MYLLVIETMWESISAPGYESHLWSCTGTSPAFLNVLGLVSYWADLVMSASCPGRMLSYDLYQPIQALKSSRTYH